MTAETPEHKELRDHSTQEVKAFFDAWTVYEKAMNANYFGHREVYGALHHIFTSRFPDGFSLIDFGCGDASFMSAALKGTSIRRYVGVDLSPVALDLARKRMEDVPGDRVFIEGHFAEVAGELELRAEIIWVGLNLHHLPLREKDRFFEACRGLLKPGGILVFFEPMCRAGENRSEHAQRWWNICRQKWTVLSKPEMESLRDHIFSADYPETLETFKDLALHHGFMNVQSIFHEPDELYQMVSLTLPGPDE